MTSTFYAPGGIFWFMGSFPNPKSTRLDTGWAQARAVYALALAENQRQNNFENQRLNHLEEGDGSRQKGSPEVD